MGIRFLFFFPFIFYFYWQLFYVLWCAHFLNMYFKGNLITYHTKCIKLSTSISIWNLSILLHSLYALRFSMGMVFDVQCSFIGWLCICWTQTVRILISASPAQPFQKQLKNIRKNWRKLYFPNGNYWKLRTFNNGWMFWILSIKENNLVIFKLKSIDNCNCATNFYAKFYFLFGMKLENINFFATGNCHQNWLVLIVICMNFKNFCI